MLVDIKDGEEAMSFSCKVMVLRKQGDKLAAQFSVIDKGIQGANLFEKLIDFNEIVGILLTIKKPIILKVIKFTYAF